MTNRFWLRPKWLFGHVLCLVLVVSFVNLGFWQLRRLDQRRDRNHLIERRMDAPPADVKDVLRGADDVAYRRVRAVGQWDRRDTTLVRNRSLDGQSGYHVLTPLLIGDSAILVDRGFAPIGGGGEPALLRDVVPPAGSVRVEGILRSSEHRGWIGPKDPDQGRLTVVNRIDVPRLQRQIDLPLEPVYLQLQAPAPSGDGLPRILPPPETSEGPHRSYAVQWFIFATVGAVGWPLLLRKTARDLASHKDEIEPAQPA